MQPLNVRTSFRFQTLPASCERSPTGLSVWSYCNWSLLNFGPNGLRPVAQWSKHSPFTSEVAGSNLRENFLNVTRSQCPTHVKRVSQQSAESRGFSPGAPVSSHREVDRVG